MPLPPPVRLDPAAVRKEIDRFAGLLVEGAFMPLLMAGVDTQSMTIKLVASHMLIQRLREDETFQETILTQLRDSLGRLVAGPEGR